jgi:outer membrane protein insertion porin family
LIGNVAASGKTFVCLLGLVASVYLAVLAIPDTLGAQQTKATGTPQYTIDRIEFDGLRRIRNDTVLARIFSRPGDPYSVDGARRDFQALWNTQFFEDIRLEVEDSPRYPDEKVLIFYVEERPIIRRIDYKGIKSITESDILDAFKDKKVGLTVESQFDPTKIKHAQVIIKALLAEHGHQFATVKPTYEKIPASHAVKLVFNVDEGPKVKVGKIIIQGNKAFSSRKIIRAMKKDRPYGIPLYFTDIPVGSKTYDRDKLDYDLEIGVRELYRDHGYFKASVVPSNVKPVDENRGGIPGPWPLIGSKHGKATDITVSIDEGEQYRMGTLAFRSADPDVGLVLNPEYLKKGFPLKPGDIFSAEKVRKAIEDYKKLYGHFGYIDFTANPITDIDDVKKVINLVWEFDQQKQFFVRRIEFTGNTTTRDKVIRREILLDEGQVYDNHLWELSILRLNQLGYFDTIKPENAELKRNPKAGTVDIRLKVKEKGKQNISFSGGVSGIAGTFIGASYQTNNFLGLGETLTLSASVGDIQRGVTFGFTEPYLFDRPISTGFTVFENRFDYNTARQYGLLVGQQVAINPSLQENYNTDSKGFTIFSSYPLRKFSFARLGVTYGWSTTDITAFSQSAQLLFEYTQFRSLAGPSALKGIRSSKITPTITYNRINNPINPTGGKMFYYGLSFEGGPLQGNVNSLSNTFSMEYFHPTYHRRNVIGLRVTTADITGYGGVNAPPFNRFYLGGENDVRGFDFYTISPFVTIPNQTSTAVPYTIPGSVDQSGKPIQYSLPVSLVEFVPTRPGGDFQSVANLEYRIPIVGNYAGLTFFNDLGLNGILRKSQMSLDPAAVQSLQEQYPNRDFPSLKISSNLPVISGTNFAPHTSAGIEFVVQLPIIQAPFRIYYAYNYARIDQTISGPSIPCPTGSATSGASCSIGGAFYISDAQRQSLPSGVLETQIVPYLNSFLATQQQKIPGSLLEPKHVLRFTVSRTF